MCSSKVGVIFARADNCFSLLIYFLDALTFLILSCILACCFCFVGEEIKNVFFTEVDYKFLMVIRSRALEQCISCFAGSQV